MITLSQLMKQIDKKKKIHTLIMGDYHGFQLLLKNQGEVNHFKLLENNVLIQKFMDLFLKFCLSHQVIITDLQNLIIGDIHILKGHTLIDKRIDSDTEEIQNLEGRSLKHILVIIIILVNSINHTL